MVAPKIRADYDLLEAISRVFLREGRASGQTLRRLTQSISTLQSGEWIGAGATKFYREMDSEVLPSMRRLNRALETGSRVTRQISQIMRQAEEESARILRGEGIGVAGGGGAGGAGGGDGGPGSGPGGGDGRGGASEGDGGGFWKDGKWKFGGKIWEYDLIGGGKFDPGIGVKYGVEGALVGDPSKDGISAFGGEIGFGAGLGKNGFTLGPHGEVYAVKGQLSGVAGDSELGLTGDAGFKALSADGFAGVKDNSFGASIGLNLASAGGTAGVNVAGYNVGVKGEIGLKAELGFKIGQETELKLPFITVGFNFGSAKGDVPIMKSAVEAIRNSHPELMRNQ